MGNDAFSMASSVGDKLLRLMTKLNPAARSSWGGWRGWVAELDRTSVSRLAAVAVLAAACGTGVLYLLNSESQMVQEEDYSVLMALGFIGLLVAYRASQRFLISRASEAIEAALHVWRQRIANKTLSLSLRDIEHISPGHLLDGIARHYAPLSQSIVTIVAGVEATVLLVFMVGYLIYLSTAAALLTAVVGFLCVIGYLNVAKQLNATMTETARLNGRLDRLSESSVEGAKELRLNADKRRAVLDDMVQTSHKLFENRSTNANVVAEVISSGNTAAYLMAGAVVFILPIISSSDSADIGMTLMAVIFLTGPIGGMIGSLQQLSIARFAARSILEFEQSVDQMLEGGAEPEETFNYSGFKQLSLRGLSYSHERAMDFDQPFSVQDVALTVNRGQLIFITGGNGSGKTTLLRVLTGLYPRCAGDIFVDDDLIPNSPNQDYRDLFATVFADFHVFGKPYGLTERAIADLGNWLQLLNIRSKLPEDLAQGFDPDALSTGQRKRLALALALAEDREILVLDEWAADQDPATRKRFYDEILPDLKKAGKTIILVTHDERYFDRSDVRLHMEEGKLRLLSPSQNEGAL